MDEITGNNSIEPTLGTVQDYLNRTERPKDLETALQQNEDLRIMLRATHNAYTYYRNNTFKWMAITGFIGGICGGVLFNLITEVMFNG